MRYSTSVDTALFGKYASPALSAFRKIHFSASYSLIMGMPKACAAVSYGGHDLWPPGCALALCGIRVKPENE